MEAGNRVRPLPVQLLLECQELPGAFRPGQRVSFEPPHGQFPLGPCQARQIGTRNGVLFEADVVQARIGRRSAQEKQCRGEEVAAGAEPGFQHAGPPAGGEALEQVVAADEDMLAFAEAAFAGKVDVVVERAGRGVVLTPVQPGRDERPAGRGRCVGHVRRTRPPG